MRNGHGLAFDGQLTLLFGGADERQVLDDTWGWDGRTWRGFAAPGPAPRTFPVMASADPGTVYLFGGRRVLFGATLDTSQLLDDLWRWQEQRWERVGAPGPLARAEAAAAWDPVRRRLMVFGGYAIHAGAIESLGDTWEFGDGRWTRYDVVGPAPRHGAVAAFEPESGEVLLDGGNGGRADTWSWNGARWRPVDRAPTPGRYNAVATTMGVGGPVMRFGGWDGAARHGDTWLWRSGSWHRRDGAAPPARNHSAVAYDARRARVVLVGGHDGERVFGDVWEWDDCSWRQVLDTAPIRRIDNGH